MNPQEYSYQDAGFDGFLSRSIDNLTQVTLDSPGPTSNSFAFDRSQQSGNLGDIITLGLITLDGLNSRIVINSSRDSSSIIIDGKNKRILLIDETSDRIVLGNLNSG